MRSGKGGSAAPKKQDDENAGIAAKAILGRLSYARMMLDTPHDRETADLMARVLDDAWMTAGAGYLSLSEDDWTEMYEAISRAVTSGLRDTERLKQLALDALHARREILCRDVFASAISFESGAALAGLHPDGKDTEHEG